MICTVLSARNTTGNKAGVSTLDELTTYSGMIKSSPLHYGLKTAPTGQKHIGTVFPDLRIIKEAELSEKSRHKGGKTA